MAQVQRKKMLWYYSAIIDWMIANPGGKLGDCAEYVGKSQTTLSIIINSDMFKAHLAARKAQFQQQHDLGIIHKTTQVANASLDAILAVLEKKRDTLPLETLNTVADGALKRLGYGLEPKQQPGITVNAQNAQVVLPVSAQDLAEARMALRQVQASQGGVQSPSLPAPEGEPEPVKVYEEEVPVASLIPQD